MVYIEVEIHKIQNNFDTTSLNLHVTQKFDTYQEFCWSSNPLTSYPHTLRLIIEKFSISVGLGRFDNYNGIYLFLLKRLR